MEVQAKIAVVHNPSKLWDDEIANRKIVVEPVKSQNAPNDLIMDLRKDPEWMIPEIRQWKSLPYKTREMKIAWLLSLREPDSPDEEGHRGEFRPKVSPDLRNPCFRWLLTVH